MGKGAQAAGGPPGAPIPTGRGPREEALSSMAIGKARKKGLIFSKGSSQDQKYRDMGSPDLNGERNITFIFAKSSLSGWGSRSGDQEYSVGGPGVGGLLSPPPPSRPPASSWLQLCTRGWIQRDFGAAPSTFSL